ncbi:cytochrome P450 [Syncephalis plumigaleata]|nr:cytochrome P450 [Syncephalis plumigaleata]
MNLLRSMTFDITGEVSFGKTFGLLEENQECHPIIEWINDRMAYNSWRYVLGYMFASFMFPKLTNSVEALDNYARAAIHKRRMTGSNERKDTLQQLIEAVDEETGATMSDEGIKSEAILLILAGTDTTAMTITWAIHFLIENPICAGRLLDEIRAIYPDPNKRISHRDMARLNIWTPSSTRHYDFDRHLLMVCHGSFHQKAPRSTSILYQAALR